MSEKLVRNYPPKIPSTKSRPVLSISDVTRPLSSHLIRTWLLRERRCTWRRPRDALEMATLFSRPNCRDLCEFPQTCSHDLHVRDRDETNTVGRAIGLAERQKVMLRRKRRSFIDIETFAFPSLLLIQFLRRKICAAKILHSFNLSQFGLVYFSSGWKIWCLLRTGTVISNYTRVKHLKEFNTLSLSFLS